MTAIDVRHLIVGVALLLAGACGEPALAQLISWHDISGPPTCAFVTCGVNGRFYAASSPYLPDGSSSYGGKLIFSLDSGRSWMPTAVTYGMFLELVVRGPRIVVERATQSASTPVQALLSTNNGESWKGILSSDYASAITGMMISSTGTVFGIARSARFGPSDYTLARYSGLRWGTLGSTLRLYGDYVSAAAMDSCGNVYLGTNEDGLYVSTDSGMSWRQTLPARSIAHLQAGLCADIIATITPNDVVTGGVYVSADTGRNWTLLGLAHNKVTSVATDAGGTMYAATDAGVYRYLGIPLQWTPLGPVNDVIDEVAASDPGILVAVSASQGIFRSSDGGTNWNKSDVRGQDVSAMLSLGPDMLVVGTYGKWIFSSSNAGESWSQVAKDSVAEYVYAMASSGGAAYAATEQGLYRSEDLGVHWANVTTAAFSGGAFSCAAGSSGSIFAGSNFGIYRSGDAGLTWELALMTSGCVTALCADARGYLLASVAAEGTYLSTDDGVSWANLQPGRNDVQSLLITPGGRLVLGVTGGVTLSTDEGASWSVKAFTSAPVYSLACAGASVAAGSGDGVYVSSDEGESWQPDNSGIYESKVLAVAFDDSARLLAGTYQGGLYQSLQTITGTGDEEPLPRETRLLANFPNPFNPRTVLRYEVAGHQRVTLRIYNILGQVMGTLVDGPVPPGIHEVAWEGAGAPSGLYLARLSAGGHEEVRKLMLIR